jgi:hypothetical protein
MMNFVLSTFLGAMKILDQEIGVCSAKAAGGLAPFPLERSDKERISNNLKFVAETCRRLRLSGAENRLERVQVAMNVGSNYAALHNELKTLKEAIEDDVKYERFYHYPKEAGNLVLRHTVDWALTLTAFPSAEMKFEVEAGVQCYALNQPTGAIFHFMRVAEYGLRALARERKIRLGNNKPIEWGTWNELILKVEKAAKDIAQRRAGPKKDAALNFYSGAVANFNGFKDQYRNSTMHVRRAYRPDEAETAMRKVRDFMNELSAKIGEATQGPLKW